MIKLVKFVAPVMVRGQHEGSLGDGTHADLRIEERADGGVVLHDDRRGEVIRVRPAGVLYSVEAVAPAGEPCTATAHAADCKLFPGKVPAAVPEASAYGPDPLAVTFNGPVKRRPGR